MRIPRFVLAGALLLTVLAGAVPTAAQEGGEQESTTNVLLTFRMGGLDDGKRDVRKAYSLVVAEGPVGSKLLAGQRVPFPASSAPGDQGVVYQNIGFSTEVRIWLVDKKTIKIMANIEDSRVERESPDALPHVETRHLTVNAVLTDGEPMELTRAEGLTGDGGGFVEIVAEILK